MTCFFRMRWMSLYLRLLPKLSNPWDLPWELHFSAHTRDDTRCSDDAGGGVAIVVEDDGWRRG